jgi:hypothetical protein
MDDLSRFTVHWPTGQVVCCDRHLQRLLAVAKPLGINVAMTSADPSLACVNCTLEAERERGAKGD